MYEMSDIGHKNVCRILLLLDEVKKNMKYWKKHSIIAFDSKKNKNEEKLIAHPK